MGFRFKFEADLSTMVNEYEGTKFSKHYRTNVKDRQTLNKRER